ncbi:hypothetical protein PV797_10165 [Clostridiaceae bacterium M8S5]|nr:hypothetical protein PV797_10165 [Clostridiaceae bacterium M8S5]
MGILDMLLVNHESILKGFEAIVKGTNYVVAYNEEGKVIAYTSGIDLGKQLMEKFIKDNGLDKTYIKLENEHHKGEDDFIKANEDYQLCIVDREIMLKKDVKELMSKEELIPYKKNKKMAGLDKYTRKAK